MFMNGFMGKVLFVDLTERTYEERTVEEQVYREYIGGFGLGARILYEHLNPKSDPLGPDNLLGFVCGPFVGTKYHGAGRVSVVAKSPLTGGWLDSSCGGNLGPRLRSTGYDGVFISGASDVPVTLLVTEETVQFLDAGDLWGKDALEAERLLKAEHGNRVGVATIGQAGEGLSLMAGIVHDQGRMAARCGVGAVMGSKRLKAVVFSGSRKVGVADEAAYEALTRRMQADVKSGSFVIDGLRAMGTPIIYAGNVSIQDAPIQNWRGISAEVYPHERAKRLDGPEYLAHRKRPYACAQCHIHCGAILEWKDQDGTVFETHRPEYETIAGFGSNCLIDDMDTVVRANEACNRYGFDTISASATIAFAMECYEKGIISDADTGGLSLAWGNKDAILPLLEAMVKRQGLGAILADGTKAAAEKLGQGTEGFAIHVAGEEVGNHDPRCWPGFGYGYVFDPKVGHHTSGVVGFIEHGFTETGKELGTYDFDHLGADKYSYEDKGRPLAVLSSWQTLWYCLGLCLFTYYGYNRYPAIEGIRALTGWNDFDLDEAIRTGERIVTLRHCFNLREGLRPQEFTLPARLMGAPPLSEGPTAGQTVDFEAVKKDYYRERDWDPATGMPSVAKLTLLGLTELVRET
jgi:aldehyde:ferredoxin oxidoreductase